MIKPVFYIIFLFCFSKFTAQENLVPNGDFEEFESCPSIDSPYYYVDRASHWFMPTLGSSDYFNSCSDYFDSTLGYHFFSVPENYNGFQDAHSGHGYGGYYAVNVPLNNEYHEYMSVKLKRPLEFGRLYKLKYYVSIADLKGDKPLQYIDHSGAFFSNSPINNNNWLRIDENPQVFNSSKNFLNDSTGWQLIEGVFVADGEEQYLTIGCFFKFQDINYNFLLGENVFLQSYYYVDDVSLFEVDLEVPNVVTPNNDGSNDCAFCQNGYENFNIEILNRWGQLVFKSQCGEGFKGIDSTGDELLEGVYFYSLKDMKDKIFKTGFIHLIR